MKILLLTMTLFMTSFQVSAQEKSVRYEYKKLEKFDFEEIGVEGEAGAPGDISISPRLRKEFQNKLPERQNFNKEMKKAIDAIR